MNNPSPRAPLFRNKRSGFALILTLSVLTVVIALTGVLIGYLDTARRDASETKAMIQANLFFADTKEILSKFKERKTLYATLYLGPVPLQSKDGRFSLMLRCRPLENGININWIAMGNNALMQAQYNAAQKVFEAIARQYELRDPARLEEMIISRADPKQTRTERSQSRLERKNGIISFEQFEALLTQYQFEADDPNIGRVPWRKYFTFRPAPRQADENLMAGDYLSVDLISVLFGLNRAVVEEEWVESEGALKSLLQRYGIVYDKSLFSEQFIDRSECEVQYGYQGERYGFSFVDIEGEVKDFAYNGKQ